MSTTTVPPRVVVPERGTGLRRSAVLTTARPDRYAWVRWPGPEAPCAFTEVPDELRDALDELGTPAGSRTVVGRPWHGARRYVLAQPRSIAEELITSRANRPAQHVDEVRELGALVRRLHHLPIPPGVPTSPPALERLQGWLDGPPLSEVHAATRAVVRRRLGPQRWERLGDWLSALRDPADPRLSHGWLGLGQCTAGSDRSTVDLLVGEDLGAGPWQLDAGWVAGQLLELRHFLGTPATAPQFDDLHDAWFDGYGRRPDAVVQHAAALDVALHVNDFSAYFRVAEDEPEAWARLLVSLCDETRW